MVNEYKIGKLAGLSLSVEPSFFIGTIVLWVALSGAGFWILNLPFSQAIIGGLVATLLYWVSYIVHHLGHAYAARRTGYPMIDYSQEELYQTFNDSPGNNVFPRFLSLLNVGYVVNMNDYNLDYINALAAVLPFQVFFMII